LSIFPLQITPQLIRSLRAFMARSSERDAVNDEARSSAVERSIDLALESLDSEKRGLIRARLGVLIQLKTCMARDCQCSNEKETSHDDL
jgi:hypothetical protein